MMTRERERYEKKEIRKYFESGCCGFSLLIYSTTKEYYSE